jgi:ABC-type transport system substrate-binding protein
VTAMTRRASLRFGAATLIGVGLLAGCGTEDNSENADPVAGGTFVQAVVEPSTRDPRMASTVGERIIVDHIYDGLTELDPRSYEVKPGLAERWETNEERDEWTFYLADVNAANGEPVTAEDVERSFRRVARADSVNTPLLSQLQGFDDYASDETDNWDGVEVVDDSTIQFNLADPYAEFPNLLTNPAFGVIHFDEDDDAVGTGPMQVDSSDEDSSDDVLRLSKVEGRDAYVDAVELRYFDDVEAAYAAFEAGEVQWAQVPAGGSAEAGERFGDNLFRDSLRTQFIAFNVENDKFEDPRFREAITRAIDRTRVLEELGVADAGLLNGVVPDGVPEAQNGGCGVKCEFDPEAAEALIDQAFPDGDVPEVVFDYPEGPPFDRPAADLVQDYLEDVGIEVDLRESPADEYAARTAADNREMFLASWSAPYPSADAFLPQLFADNSPSNVFEINDDGVDRKLEQARAEEDGEMRARYLQEAERDIMARMPLVPLAQFPINAVAAEPVMGVDPSPTGNFDIASVWLRPADD